MKTLISHEWLAPHGGSENVFEQLALAIPDADKQCLWNDAPARFGADVKETWLAKTPLRKSKAAALPFLSAAWRSVDLTGYERVLASSHAFGHHLASRAATEGKQAFAFVHTPARYIWTPDLDERGNSQLVRLASRPLQRLDCRHASSRVFYAANSDFVRQRIRHAWNVDATVIYPPVAVSHIQSVPDWSLRLTGREADFFTSLPDAFVLGASRLIEYKRLDLAMKVGEALDLPVVVAGGGPYEPELREFARSVAVPVHFAGRVSDELLYALYQRAELFAFMAIEDFGIMPVEAMATGTPVLVNKIGGAAESARLLDGGVGVSQDADLPRLRSAAQVALTKHAPDLAARTRLLSEENFRRQINMWTEREQ